MLLLNDFLDESNVWRLKFDLHVVIDWWWLSIWIISEGFRELFLHVLPFCYQFFCWFCSFWISFFLNDWLVWLFSVKIQILFFCFFECFFYSDFHHLNSTLSKTLNKMFSSIIILNPILNLSQKLSFPKYIFIYIQKIFRSADIFDKKKLNIL